MLIRYRALNFPIVCFIYCIVQGILSPVFAQNKVKDNPYNNIKCLDKVWERSTPSESEKSFDLEHDVSLFDYRFSCLAELSPSEVNNVLTIMKQAIANNDRERLADISSYPYRYWIETVKRTEYGFRAAKIAKNKQEFIEKYDEIVTPLFRNIIECTTIDQVEPRPMGIVTIAEGYIFLGKWPDNNKDSVRNFHKYPLSHGSSGPIEERTKKWFIQNCR